MQVGLAVSVPASVALPFGAFERALAEPANAHAAAAIEAAEAQLVCLATWTPQLWDLPCMIAILARHNCIYMLHHMHEAHADSAVPDQAAADAHDGVPRALEDLRRLVGAELAAPAGLASEAAAAAESAGLVPAGHWAPGSATWAAAWHAICQVRMCAVEANDAPFPRSVSLSFFAPLTWMDNANAPQMRSQSRRSSQEQFCVNYCEKGLLLRCDSCCVQVWASKWSERAWLSRRARGVPEQDLRMAVLLQQVNCRRLFHAPCTH